MLKKRYCKDCGRELCELELTPGSIVKITCFGCKLLNIISLKLKLPENLTPKEYEVIKLLATGSTNSEIATALNHATSTTKNHMTNLFRKFNVTNRQELNYKILRSKIC